MRQRFPHPDQPLTDDWRAPLECVARALVDSPINSDQFFDLGDFMIMSRLLRSPRPDIVLYKHIHTRRYINVDDAGHTYRYYPPRTERTGRYGQYRPHKSLRDAVSNLGLWELPWMKHGLEVHRQGFSWDQRRELFNYETEDLFLTPRPRGGFYGDSWVDDRWDDMSPEGWPGPPDLED